MMRRSLAYSRVASRLTGPLLAMTALAIGGSCAPVCRGVDGACLDLRVEGAGSYTSYEIEWRYAISEEPLAALRRGATEQGGDLPRTFRILPPPGVAADSVRSLGVLGLSEDGSEQASGSVETRLGGDEHAIQVMPLGLRVYRRDVTLATSSADLIAVDLNGDSVIDLAVVGTPKSATANSTKDGVLSVLYGVGDGTYRAPQVFDIPTQAMSVHAVDVNGDNRRDLLTSGAGDSFSLFMNGASGQFTNRTPILNSTGLMSGDCQSGSDTHSVAVADV